MKIGIDARLIEETGVGRYIRNLIAGLARVDKKNEYVVFLRKKSFDGFILSNRRWSKILAEVPWHGIREQFEMPGIFQSAHLDLLHVPYHNPPIFYSGPMVVTIHDLTILHFATGKATTLPFGLYVLKRFGYWIVLSVALSRAKKIITVSETTKAEILDHFHSNPSRIAVTYEGIDTHLKIHKAQEPEISGAYVLYVGNAYPHKNLDVLLEAMRHVDCRCVLVGNRDIFYEDLERRLTLYPNVRFFGPANDSQLINLYKNAVALVVPSMMEGFGLPPLEALSFGCPVVVSDIPIFHEILKHQAVYFDPHSAHDLAKKLQMVMASGHGSQERQKARREYTRQFSWDRMAEETRGIYESSACV